VSFDWFWTSDANIDSTCSSNSDQFHWFDFGTSLPPAVDCFHEALFYQFITFLLFLFLFLFYLQILFYLLTLRSVKLKSQDWSDSDSDFSDHFYTEVSLWSCCPTFLIISTRSVFVKLQPVPSVKVYGDGSRGTRLKALNQISSVLTVFALVLISIFCACNSFFCWCLHRYKCISDSASDFSEHFYTEVSLWSCYPFQVFKCTVLDWKHWTKLLQF
jgi:hypothetical protein